jgi:hypothetical protein
MSAAQCGNTVSEGECSAECAPAGCVPVADVPVAAFEKICAVNPKSSCGAAGSSTVKFCEWSDGQGVGPTFTCDCDNAALDCAWAIVDKGECSTAGNDAQSICDYYTDTNCLVAGECITETQGLCAPLAPAAAAACTIPCFNHKKGDNTVCADCLYDYLLQQFTIDPETPDVFTCCGCMDEIFDQVGCVFRS